MVISQDSTKYSIVSLRLSGQFRPYYAPHQLYRGKPNNRLSEKMNIEDRVIDRPSDTCIPFEGTEQDLYDGIGAVVARFNDGIMTDLYYLAEVILTQSVTDDAQQATLNAVEFCKEPG